MSTKKKTETTSSVSNPKYKIAVIGAGKIGEAILSALIKSNFIPPNHITVTTRKPARKAFLEKTYGVKSADNPTAAAQADVVLLSVKPQMAKTVISEIKPALRPRTLLISVMAGITIAQMEHWLEGGYPVIRAMPNTPLRIGKGMTAISGGKNAAPSHLDFATSMFDKVGRTRLLDEKYFDAVTGLSASGPAFVYIMIESLAEGGVKAGLPRDVATELAAQACLGASAMVLETGEHPALLKDEVTTPAGCTIDGILKLEEGGIRVTLIKTVMEAAKKAHELGRVNDNDQH